MSGLGRWRVVKRCGFWQVSRGGRTLCVARSREDAIEQAWLIIALAREFSAVAR